MEIIKGKYTNAVVFTTDNKETALDDHAAKQLQQLCDMESMKNCRIRVMPDVHPGMLGTIGFTATIGDKIMPMLLGTDIGCGMTVTKISKGRKEWQRLDAVIRENIPFGSAIRKEVWPGTVEFDIEELQCIRHIQKDRVMRSLGTLGGGNHFIEVDADDEGMYLIIHSGSRHLGKEITDHYMKTGQEKLKKQGIDLPYELTWIEGDLMDSYFRDVHSAQKYASISRSIMTREILKGMKWKVEESWDCPHNYITEEKLSGSFMLRKGAISAKDGERVVIPINMRDGVILGIGLGNEEWNYSAPHGSGRILRRDEAGKSYTVSSFRSEMEGIYCDCIGQDTLDEAPFAYRGIEEIQSAISASVRIDTVLKPLYNFKAGGKT